MRQSQTGSNRSYNRKDVYLFKHDPNTSNFFSAGMLEYPWPSFEYPMDIDGTTVWSISGYGPNAIQKFDTQKPELLLHTVVFPYIGNFCRNTRMYPHDVVIDGENLLTIAKKDGKLQLFTIKPLYDE